MPLPALAVGAIKAAPAIAGFIGNLMDRSRRKREENKASAGISNLADIFKNQLGQDYFDSAEGSAARRTIDNEFDENANEINAVGNINGLTDEAKIAMMGKNMKAKQGALSGLAGNSNLWRQRGMMNYQGVLGQLFEVGMNNRFNTNNSINNIVGNMKTGLDGAMNAGVFDKMLGGGRGSKGMMGQMAGGTGLFG